MSGRPPVSHKPEIPMSKGIKVSFVDDDWTIALRIAAVPAPYQGVEGVLCLLTDKVDKEVIDAADKLKVAF